MHNQEIEELLEESGAPCVSIIIPVHRVSPERSIDEGLVKKIIKQAKDVIKTTYQNANGLINKIDELVAQIDHTHTKEGIGIFVSDRVSKMIQFPFPVIEKIKIGGSFEQRDLLYYKSKIIDYCIFSISKKHLHLFTATGEDIREIKNDDFPINYVEYYEYAKPTRGTSFSNNTLKEFEKDKSVVQELRLIDFLRTADHLIGKYVNAHVPLIVSGGSKEIADYLHITQHKDRILGKVTGNYNFNGDVQLANLSWAEVQNQLGKRNKIILSDLRELFGRDMVAMGVEEVWKDANEGKGLELVVEKDYECDGFISSDGFELKTTHLSDDTAYSPINDVVEKIIRTVRNKRGKVLFVDNGEMKDFNKIALRLRYSGNSQ